MRNDIPRQETCSVRSQTILLERVPRVPGLLSFLLFMLMLGPFAFGQTSDTAAIAYVQQLPTFDLDSTVSGGVFGDWVQSLAGRTAKVEWELNDCGEQTGVPMIDAERDFPMCVGAYAALPGDVRFGITIIIGTYEKGPTDTPAIYDIYIQSGKTVRTLRHLKDLQNALMLPSRKH